MAEEARQTSIIAYAMVAAPLALLLTFLVVPSFFTLIPYSFYKLKGLVIVPELTLENYARLFKAIYFNTLLRTLGYSVASTVLSLVIMYPLAYYVWFKTPRERRDLLVMLVIVPYWAGYLARMYGWIALLRGEGFIEGVLRVFGLDWAFVEVLYTPIAVIIGFVHVYSPLMFLALYSSMRNVERAYIEAANDLGAGPIRTFFHVLLPLTKPGIVAGSVIVFVLVFGSFVTPALLGGPGDLMLGNIVERQFKQTIDWPFGAAMAVVMMVFVLSLLIIFRRYLTARVFVL